MEHVIGIPNFSVKDTEELFRRQAKTMRKVRAIERGEVEAEERVLCPDTLLILDDCVDSGVVSFRGSVDKIAERGRHVNLSMIVSSQRLSAISRSIRLNSDYFVTFSPYSVSELEQFLTQFCSKANWQELRLKIAEIYTKPFEFILLDNSEKDVTKKLSHTNADDFVKGKRTTIEMAGVAESVALHQRRQASRKIQSLNKEI